MFPTKVVDVVLFFSLMFINELPNAYGRDFGYNGQMGPSHWAEQYNSCSGKYQSPININVLDVMPKSFPELEMIRFNVYPEKGLVWNNGHTVVVKLEYDNMKPIIAGGPLDDEIFVYTQLHFHWGQNDTMGSEDRINNQTFPAELHMVFCNSKYLDLDEALAHNDGVVVLAFFYTIQEEDNPDYVQFAKLLEKVREPDQYAKVTYPLKLSQLISDDLEKYYTYIGSLTTPPCSEDITWIDFATPIGISSEQIKQFRSLLTHEGQPLTHNYRPIQPLNNRTVYQALPPKLTKLNLPPLSAIPFVDAEYADDGGAAAWRSVTAATVTFMGISLLLVMQ